MNKQFSSLTDIMKLSKQTMSFKSITVYLIFLRVVLGLPQDCGCPRGRPNFPLQLNPDNNLYYQQNGHYLSQLSSPRSTDSFLQGLSRYIAGHHGVVSSENPIRKSREIKSEISSLPHDVNFQQDSVIPIRVIRQSEDDKKNHSEAQKNQKNATVSQDGKNGQELRSNNDKNQKPKKITGPLVPGPRVKISREQKMAADSLLEHEITPTSTKLTGPDFELDEVIPDPSISIETTKQIVENSLPQYTRQLADVYKETETKLPGEVYYYPVKRYAEYIKTPQNQIVLVPQAIRPLPLIRSPITYEDLINLQNFGAYDADYLLDDYINDSITDQIEKPTTSGPVTEDKLEEKSINESKDQKNLTNEKKIVSRVEEVKAEDFTSTTQKL